MSKCKNCAFITFHYATLANPGGSGALCTLGLWSDYAPPDTDEFDDCSQFRSRALCQRAADCEKGLNQASDEMDENK